MNIVFVHLNTAIPKYLKKQLVYCVEQFAGHDVYLIHNLDDLNLRIGGLKLFKYNRGEDSQIIESALSHPKEFRGNFWFTSIERFIAIKALMQNNNSELIHVESDVLLSTDFPFEKFTQLTEDIAYPITSKLRGVASTLYVRNLESITHLVKFSIECASRNSQTSDMLILGEYKKKFPKRVAALPFGPISPNAYLTETPPKLFEEMKRNFQYFQGVFDGSDVGVYFFGTDPRNRRGISTLRVPINFNYAAITRWTLTYSEKRKFLEVGDFRKESIVPIFTIHATSKDPRLFMLKYYPKKLAKAVENSKKNVQKKLVVRIAVIQIVRSVQSRIKKVLKKYSLNIQ